MSVIQELDIVLHYFYGEKLVNFGPCKTGPHPVQEYLVLSLKTISNRSTPVHIIYI